MIKVSIIIPVYNVEKYLGECLDSLFHQTLKEIEVVCINDGSTDNSLEILYQFKKSHSNMQVITQENSGSGKARNLGINLANGEYLMFIDPDDYLASDDVVETLYKAAKRNNVEVCGGSLVSIKDGTVSKEVYGFNSKSIVKEDGLVNFSDYQYPLGHVRYIIKKSLLVDNAIFYPEYRRGQDVPFMTNVLITVGKFYLIKKDVYVYRRFHKEEKFTVEKTDDIINSLYDTMVLAIINHLNLLFDDMVRAINTYAKKYMYKFNKRNNTWHMVTRINELIEKGNLVFNYEKSRDLLFDEPAYEGYLADVKIEGEKIEKVFASNRYIAIYGAGEGGILVCRYMLAKGHKPSCFVVSDKSQNPKSINGIKVMEIDKLQNIQQYLFVIGAIKEEVKAEMKACLKNIGCMNTLDFDLEILSELII